MKESRFYRFFRPVIPRFLRPFVLRYQEVFSYLFFGALTVAVNLLLYFLLCRFMGYLAANVVAWVGAVLFAFVVNRHFVFESDSTGVKAVTFEVVTFFAARIFSLLVEELILYVFVERLRLPNGIVKFAAQLLVIVLNYFASKCIIFASGRRK